MPDTATCPGYKSGCKPIPINGIGTYQQPGNAFHRRSEAFVFAWLPSSLNYDAASRRDELAGQVSFPGSRRKVLASPARRGSALVRQAT